MKYHGPPLRQFVYLSMAMVLIYGCSRDYESIVAVNNTNPDSGKRAFTDVMGDASEEFVDLERMEVEVDSSEIKVTLDLVNIPPLLLFNHDALADNLLNYSWHAIFDLDSNNQLSQNDLVLAVNRFKVPNVAQFEGDLLSNTQHGLWEGTGSGARFIAHISASVTGDKISMVFDKAAADSLFAKIHPSTNIIFETYFYDGVMEAEDRFPD